MKKRWQVTAIELIDVMVSRNYPESVTATVTGAMEYFPEKAEEIKEKIMNCSTPKDAVKAVQPYLRAHLSGWK